MRIEQHPINCNITLLKGSGVVKINNQTVWYRSFSPQVAKRRDYRNVVWGSVNSRVRDLNKLKVMFR